MAWQLLLNGLVSGLLLALPAISLTLVFGVLKFSNFAIGALMTVGAFAAWTANGPLHLPMAMAAALACVVTGLVAVLAERLVFAKVRAQGSIVLLVASLGVSLVLENICRFAFGNATRSYDLALARPLRWQGLRISQEQIVTGGVVLAALLVFQLLMYATPLGRAMRALADDASLAAARGIDTRRMTNIVWLLAGGLAGLAGVLAGMDRAVEPLLGWSYQISVFAAAILGGLGNPAGAVLGALVIGIAEELSGLFIPTNYRQVVSFGLILVLLLFMRRGLLGRRAVRQ